MDLITPSFGLIFWQSLIFLVVLFVLGKYGWKPILNALKAREASIQNALNVAEKARQEVEKLHLANERLLAETRQERDKILREAAQMAVDIKERAKEDAARSAHRLVEDARAGIRLEKEQAMKDIKKQIAELSLLVSEKLLRKNLAGDKAQQDLIRTYVEDLKNN
jgi:F-type H+-transporting ATPase subunit b